jgi:hypothetical protein
MKTIAVGTKATPEQVARWQEAAGQKTLSEWVRDALDQSLERESLERRLDRIERILLNVAADLSDGVKITPTRVRQYCESLQ